MNERPLNSCELLELLKPALIREFPSDTTSVTIFINCEGIEIKTRRIGANKLKKSGISMRNINGDFIK